MIAIIDYEAGNIRSLQNGLERVGAEAVLTKDPELIRSAERVIFPGVGEASSAMLRLRRLGLDQLIPALTQPVLGICLGLQLMCRYSDEGDTPGLGIFDADVKRFTTGADSTRLKVPQVGWNSVRNLSGPLFKGITEGTDFYFVHSYYADKSSQTVATTEYGIPFSASLQKDNFFAVQFHPEISSKGGETMLRNFLNLNLDLI